jgi:hypothetical protein
LLIFQATFGRTQALLLSSPISSDSETPTPSVAEKAANLIAAVAKKFPYAGALIEIMHGLLGVVIHNTSSVRAGTVEYSRDSLPDSALRASKWMGVASASSAQELAYLLNDLLKEQGLITESGHGSQLYKITPQGWRYITELSRTQSQSTKAFIAMSFAPELNKFFIDGMAPGVRAAGYEALRIE